MTQKNKQSFDTIRRLAQAADKPARYLGGEMYAPKMKKNAALKYLLCFPDVYEIGMSNLGVRIIENVLNARADTVCEYCFAPWADFAQILTDNNVNLYGLSTYAPMHSYDMVGFSLSYELCYSTVLYMLRLGGVPLKRAERGSQYPVIVAGGPCTVNPLPLEDFIDIFVIGDGESVTDELAQAYIDCKKQGIDKHGFLQAASKIRGVYVSGISKSATRRVEENLNSAAYPLKTIIPNTEAVFDRSVLEIFRGCSRGCRFCQAGFIYRPVRERSVDTLLTIAKKQIKNHGYGEISLSSLSACDYPHLGTLTAKLKPVLKKSNVRLSVPSTRLDSFDTDVSNEGKLGSITFAPEAGTQRLRDVINKNISEQDIESGLVKAFKRGYSSVKLYFMIGLPTETQEDIEGIVKMVESIKRLYKQHRTAQKPLTVGVSASTFIPKPFTPFQREPLCGEQIIAQRQEYLMRELRKRGVKASVHGYTGSLLEAVLSRGDRRLGAVLLQAFNNGARLDAWREFFDFEIYKSAFAALNIDYTDYTCGFDNVPLPWEVIDCGITREYLEKELEAAKNAVSTPDCRSGCRNCGLSDICFSGEGK